MAGRRGKTIAKGKRQARVTGSARREFRDLEAPPATGSEAAYERFLPEAQAIDGPIVPFRADAPLAYHNVRAGVEAVLAREPQVKADLPKFDLEEARGLPDLGLAVVFAAARVDRGQGSAGAIRKLLAEASGLRTLLLTSADALAQAAIIPSRAVEKLRSGRRSAIDLATDCIELAALFRTHADAVRGKSPVNTTDVTQAAEVGTNLLALLRPKGTPRVGTAKELKEAVDLRDRFWTLLVRRHDRLRRAASWLFGDDVDRNVPALQSRLRSKRTKPAPPAPPAPSR